MIVRSRKKDVDIAVGVVAPGDIERPAMWIDADLGEAHRAEYRTEAGDGPHVRGAGLDNGMRRGERLATVVRRREHDLAAIVPVGVHRAVWPDRAVETDHVPVPVARQPGMSADAPRRSPGRPPSTDRENSMIELSNCHSIQPMYRCPA